MDVRYFSPVLKDFRQYPVPSSVMASSESFDAGLLLFYSGVRFNIPLNLRFTPKVLVFPSVIFF